MQPFFRLIGNPSFWLIGAGAALCAFGPYAQQQGVGGVLIGLGVMRWFIVS